MRDAHLKRIAASADTVLMRVLLFGLLVCVLSTGCFVFDELDAGMEIMDSHTSHANKKREAEKKAAKAGKGDADEKPPTYAGAVQDWFQNAKTLGPREPSGDDPLIQCALGGSTRFMRQSDCVSQGGRPQ